MMVAGFDEIAVTGAARDALGELRSATEEVDGPMERHCLRARHIAAELAGRRAWMIDGRAFRKRPLTMPWIFWRP